MDSKKVNENDDHQREDELHQTEGEKFLKELRSLPYNNSLVGQSFIILPKKAFQDNEEDDQA